MPLSAQSRLILVLVKIERSNKHLVDLEVTVRKFKDESQHVFISEPDPKPTSYAPLVKLPKQSFDALACAGDVIHTLRTALDHLAMQLVFATGK
jgi:hypothetical protein